MPRGLAIPVAVGQNGGARLVEGDENDTKIILLALMGDDNDNAFQQNIGMGSGMIFDIADPLVRIKVLSRLRSIFRRFEQQKRFRLREETLKFTNPNEGEQAMEFKYVNLESDEEKDFRNSFSASGAGTRAE